MQFFGGMNSEANAHITRPGDILPQQPQVQATTAGAEGGTHVSASDAASAVSAAADAPSAASAPVAVEASSVTTAASAPAASPAESAQDTNSIGIGGGGGQLIDGGTLLASLPAHSHQQLEEERVRKDILRYLVTNSNGTYHYSAELRAIAYDVVGMSTQSSALEQTQALQNLLDVLHGDPQKRFLISGEGDNIIVKRCFVRGDEEEISDLVEEWRGQIASFLMDCKRSVGLSDIGSSVPRPARIPSSVKLIFIMKTDPLNRFLIKGDGNAAKARYNMQIDPDEEGRWMNRWRDDIAAFMTKQQWASPTVGLHEIGAHVERPFFLPARVKLLDTLQQDPLQRFLVTGTGNDTRVMVRTFRGDEPEIEEYVEHWRLLIAQYLMSKSSVLGPTQVRSPRKDLLRGGARRVRRC